MPKQFFEPRYLRLPPRLAKPPRRSYHYVAFDSETYRFTPDNPTPKPVCVTLAGRMGFIPRNLVGKVEQTSDKTWRHLATPQEGYEALQACWEAGVFTAAHNLSFDLRVAKKHCGWSEDYIMRLLDQGLVCCTLTRESLVLVRQGKETSLNGLADTVFRHFRLKLNNKKSPQAFEDKYGHLYDVCYLDWPEEAKEKVVWRSYYKALEGVPFDQWPKRAKDYALEDAELADVLIPSQRKKFCLDDVTEGHELGWWLPDEFNQTWAEWAGSEMATENGPRMDPLESAKFEAKNRKKLKECFDVEVHGGWMSYERLKKNRSEILPGESRSGWKRVSEVLKNAVAEAYQSQGLPIPRKNPTPKMQAKGITIGNIKTDKDTLNMPFIEDNYPALHAKLQGQVAEKMVSSYVPIIKRAGDNPLRSRFNVLLRTGRTSWSGPSLQVMPRGTGFRDCFMPSNPEENCFAMIDYSSLELCTLGQVCLWRYGRSRLADAINAGKDAHLSTAAMFLNMAYEQALAQKKTDRVKIYRQAAKAANFGFPGGMGAARVVQTYGFYLKPLVDALGLTYDEVAKMLKKRWLEQNPVMRDYFKDIAIATANDTRFDFVHPLTGRERGGLGYCDGANIQFQGLAADGAKYVMRLLHKACSAKNGILKQFGVKMWVFIHDEFGFEGPKKTFHLWAPIAAKIMVEGMQRFVPDVEIAAPEAGCPRWYKEADTILDDDGVLCGYYPAKACLDGNKAVAYNADYFPGKRVIVPVEDRSDPDSCATAMKKAKGLFEDRFKLRWALHERGSEDPLLAQYDLGRYDPKVYTKRRQGKVEVYI